jgi:hypothetical protein
MTRVLSQGQINPGGSNLMDGKKEQAWMPSWISETTVERPQTQLELVRTKLATMCTHDYVRLGEPVNAY